MVPGIISLLLGRDTLAFGGTAGWPQRRSPRMNKSFLNLSRVAFLMEAVWDTVKQKYSETERMSWTVSVEANIR